MRTTVTVPVIICDGCEKEIPKDSTHIRVMVRARVVIDGAYARQGGIEEFQQDAEDGLSKVLEYHVECDPGTATEVLTNVIYAAKERDL